MTAKALDTGTEKDASLYDRDFCLWLEQTASLLHRGKFSELDVPNLIEEIESMGRSEKQALTSNLRIVLMHLLKYRYQPQRRSNSWRHTLVEHRLRLQEAFKASPSLKRHYAETFVECYQNARKLAAAETGLSVAAFPEESPFSPEQALDIDYFPD